VYVTNGYSKVNVYSQTLEYGIANTSSYQDNLLLSGRDMIATFDYGYNKDYRTTRMDIASYGAYKTDWKFPNLTCVINPYVTNVNVTYSNTTGLFNATVLGRSDKTLQWSRDLAQVNNWLFRVFTVGTGVSPRAATSHLALILS
jgi:hypothetical protein